MKGYAALSEDKGSSEDSDLTQTELCSKLYMHKTTYTNYEQGKHTVPLDFAVTLADFYNVSIDYIAGRTNVMDKTKISDTSDDGSDILKLFSKLSERNKGRAEQFIRQLYDKQEEQKFKLKEAK